MNEIAAIFKAGVKAESDKLSKIKQGSTVDVRAADLEKEQQEREMKRPK